MAAWRQRPLPSRRPSGSARPAHRRRRSMAINGAMPEPPATSSSGPPAVTDQAKYPPIGPRSPNWMASHPVDFLQALGLAEVDLLGFSIGGYVAQALAIRNPRSIRTLMLVGTRPRGGEASTDPKNWEYATSIDPATG